MYTSSRKKVFSFLSFENILSTVHVKNNNTRALASTYCVMSRLFTSHQSNIHLSN